MKFFLKFLRLSLIWLFTGFTLAILLMAGTYVYLAPDLPEIDTLKDVQLQTPLRVFSREGALIAEFGEKKRSPLNYAEVPDLMVKAVLAAEDDRFFEHPGVDYQGILRAVIHLVKTGRKGQGGSTITMQVARNFFLSREKTYLRKLNEIFLALKIERELTKQEILELYLNKIYLGTRSYGVAAAAQVYYGKNIKDLSVDQFAMIAGLPKAPSKYNPIANNKRATIRRNYVLGRMHELEFIDQSTYNKAIEIEDNAKRHGLSIELNAPYMAEMVRAELVKQYGNDAYTLGYRVYTTLDTRLQRFANNALRRNILEYDLRHGYRGSEGHIELEPDLLAALPEVEAPVLNQPGSAAGPQRVVPPDLSLVMTASVREQLKDIPVVGGLVPVVVLYLEDQAMTVLHVDGRLERVAWKGLKWAREYKDENRRGPRPKFASDIANQGDIVRLATNNAGEVRLAQIPAVKGALVSMTPETGEIRSLVGGFDFYYSKFNRVTQAYRQPGSNFKPFIYSAALDSGYTAASLINDAPVVFEDAGLENTWRPENYSGKFFGPTRLRVGLMKSRNLISIRLLRAIGIKYAINYAKKFGFDEKRIPKDLSLALGSTSLTPMDLLTGYAAIANGGYRVFPSFIQRIEDSRGEVIYQNNPVQVCHECEKQAELELQRALQREIAETNGDVEDTTADDIDNRVEQNTVQNDEKDLTSIRVAERVMTEQNNYIMRSILSDVIRSGTGRRARKIGRADLAGKTGTTNEQKDAWFSGYSSTLVTTAWMGFDQHQPLGAKETGASAALPMWIYFMENAMKGVPEKVLEVPAGIVSVRIDPETGLLAAQGQTNAIFETFRTVNVPKETAQVKIVKDKNTNVPDVQVPEQIF